MGRARTLFRVGRRVGVAAAWTLVPLLFVFVTAVGVHGAGPAWRASQGEGTLGTFTAVERVCGRSKVGEVCSWRGTFTSRDRNLRLDDVLLDPDPPGWGPGSTATVIWPGELDPPAVYFPGSHSEFVLASAFAALGIAGLVTWLVALGCALTRRPYPGWIEWVQNTFSWPPDGHRPASRARRAR